MTPRGAPGGGTLHPRPGHYRGDRSPSQGSRWLQNARNRRPGVMGRDNERVLEKRAVPKLRGGSTDAVASSKEVDGPRLFLPSWGIRLALNACRRIVQYSIV
jgi:hypothetical protein